MHNHSEPYLAYMLRIWPVEGHGKITWRASLQCISSEERHGFEDLEALFEHLRRKTEETPIDID